MNRFLLAPIGIIALTALLPAGSAQGQEVSQLAIQRPDAVNELNGHLAKLAQDPRDVSALIGAGEAALALDDPRGATGFFARAEAIQGSNGRIKAGLGRAMLGMHNPAEALRLFDQATRMGYPATSFIADRALAYDLEGNQTAAQKDYQVALQAKPDDAELIRQYAVSLGISGDVDGAEAKLKPLLVKSDRGAWRDRAFILAMNGRRTEALELTNKTMPPALAQAIKPYMERMSLLNPAQRAAAVHFGIFPSDPAIRTAQLAPEQPRPSPPAAAAAKAQPIDSRAARRARREEEKRRKTELAMAKRNAATKRTQPPEPQPAIADAQRSGQRLNNRVGSRIGDTPTQVAQQTAAEADRAARAEEERIRLQREQAARTAKAPEQAPAQSPVRTAEAATRPESFSQRENTSAPVTSSASARVQGPPATAPSPTPLPSQAVTPRPAEIQGPPAPARETVLAAAEPVPPPPPANAPTPSPAATRTLADIMRELQVPDSERQASVPAVDLAEIAMIQQQRRAKQQQTAAEKAKVAAAAKAKAEADAKTKAEAAEKARIAKNPARSWVQVGVGRDLSAMPFTWKALKKEHASLASRDPWTAAWGRTNRLLVGPFASFAKAKDYEAQLKKAGADVFAWQSDAGEDVARLSGQ